MTNFLARFIPHYSTTTAPIRKQAQKEQTFELNLEQQSAFDRLNIILSSAPVVTYFDESKKTEIIVDAYPVALSGMLVQYNGNKPTVVAYGSRALSAVEQRYRRHIEREALAVV